MIIGALSPYLNIDSVRPMRFGDIDMLPDAIDKKFTF